MHANNGGVDHLDSGIVGSGKCVDDAGPYTSPPPVDEPVVAGGAMAISLWQIAPWGTGSQPPGDTGESTSVICTWHAARFVGEKRYDHVPFEEGARESLNLVQLVAD